MKSVFAFAFCLATLASAAASAGGQTLYRNPVLPGDYSDPDVTRVGEDFYLVSSSFSNAPGLPVLHSKDLVHWQTVGYALETLSPEAHYRTPRHGGGVWAPAIRYRNGKFVIYYPDPDIGILRVEAENPAGPWSAPVVVDGSRGAIDPCPFWDDDGTGWLVHGWAYSRAGFNNVITLKRLNADGTKTVGEAVTIVDGNKLPLTATGNGMMPWITIEGPKLYKRNGWYYLFVPAGGVPGGWQGVFRSRKITGPYEGRDVLDQGGTTVNGPHQGAWVATAAGEDWFMHFQDTGAYGRRVWLEPMTWKGDWPVIGVDKKHIGRGEPVLSWRMPKTAVSSADPIDDEFDGRIGPLWQWNANPAADWADLKASPGRLRLKSVSFPENLWEDSAILTRKLSAERFSVTTKVLFQPKTVGERAGLTLYGKDYAWIGLENTAAGIQLIQVYRQNAYQNAPETKVLIRSAVPAAVYLRADVEPVTIPQSAPYYSPYWPSMLYTTNLRVGFSYSLDGQRFIPSDETFDIPPGMWVGAQIGLFAQSPAGTPAYSATSVGWAEYDWVKFGLAPNPAAKRK